MHVQLLPLPEPFDKALNAKRESVKHLKAAIREAGLEDRARSELQRAVQAHFRVRAQPQQQTPLTHSLTRLLLVSCPYRSTASFHA